MQPICKGLYVQYVQYPFDMGSKRVWKTIALPESTLNEVKENMEGYISVSEFVRAAIRYFIDYNKRLRLAQNESLEATILDG